MTVKRKYEETHPWLTFSVDLKPASPELWMMLGECQSKLEHLARVPLRPEVAKELNKMYVAKGVLATTAIEGNTMTENEVQKFLNGELKLPPSREYQGQEITNIADECNRITMMIFEGAIPVLNIDRIKELNSKVLDKLNLEEGIEPGEIRHHEVGVALYRGAPSEDCEYLLEQLCRWLNSIDQFGSPTDSRALVYAILKSVLAHLYLAWIHPFGDGNGRTARLVEYQILTSSGLPEPATHLLSNHYNLTRNEYYRQLHLASKSGGDVLPFIFYAVQGLLDGLRNQLDLIREQVLDMVWRSHLYDVFFGKTGQADLRRRDLMEDLSMKDAPVRLEDIGAITPRVVRHYANRTGKTLTRDIVKLMGMGLIMWNPNERTVRARKEAVLAFLPFRAILKDEKKRRKQRTAV